MAGSTEWKLPTVGQQSLRLIGYAVPVFASHCVSATLAEFVFRREGFAFPGIYGAVEFGVFAVMPSIALTLQSGLQGARRLLVVRREELVRFFICGIAMAVSHVAGLSACVRVNYTTAMLFGSAKLPSVMIIGAVLNAARGHGQKQQRNPPWQAYALSLCVTAGLVAFGLAERRDAPRFSTVGLLLVALNLCLSSVTFNLQQRVLQRSTGGMGTYLAGNGAEADPLVSARLMTFQYASAFCLTLTYAAVSGEFESFCKWCCRSGGAGGVWRELLPVVCGAVLTSVGVRALLCVTQEFDAPRASVITASRKAITFITSYLIFPKPFSALHLVGVILTIGGSCGVHFALSKNRSRGSAN